MSIQSGTHLGPYGILSAIGAGGMAEVYRTRDPKLGYTAIKTLLEKSCTTTSQTGSTIQSQE